MPLVFTLDAGFPQRMGKRQICTGAVAFDNSYLTGGEAVLATDFGMVTLDQLSFGGGQQGFLCDYDDAAATIQVTLPAFARHCINPAQAAVDLAGAAADVATFQFGHDLWVVGFSSVVTVAVIATGTDPAMTVEKRDPDGAANAVELAELTYTDTDAVGEVDSVFVGEGDVGGSLDTAAALASPYPVAAGETLVLQHEVQCVGGAIAGESICHIWVVSSDQGEELPNTFDLSALTAVRFTALGY